MWDMGYRYGHPRYRYGIWDIDMGDDSIDTVILDIDMGYLVTLVILHTLPRVSNIHRPVGTGG